MTPSSRARVVALAVALRRRRRDVVAPCAVALTGLAGAFLVTSRLPGDGPALRSPANQVIWRPVSAIVWISAAIALWFLTSILWRRLGRPDIRVPRMVAPVAACVALGLVLVPYTTTVRPQEIRESILWGAIRTHTEAIEREAAPGSTVRIRTGDLQATTYAILQSLVGQLRMDGYTVQVDPFDIWGFWIPYQSEHPSDETPDLTVYIAVTGSSPPPPEGSRRISSWDPAEPTSTFEGFDRLGVFGIGGAASRIFVVPADDPAAAP